MLTKFFLLTLLLTITSCATQTHNRPEPPKVTEALEAIWEAEVSEFINKSNRLARISSEILSKGIGYCGKMNYTTPHVGIYAWSRYHFEDKWYRAALSKFDLGEEPQIYRVDPFSAAEDAGLKSGDKILEINGKAINYSNHSSYLDLLQEAINSNKTIIFTIRRKNSEYKVPVEPKIGCKIYVSLLPNFSDYSTRLRYFYFDSTFSALWISKGLMDFLKSDEEIALIISHELAHGARKHHEANNLRKGIGWFTGALLGGALDAFLGTLSGKEENEFSDILGEKGLHLAGKITEHQEKQADYDALHLMAIAGYDIENLAISWRKIEEFIDPNYQEMFRYFHPMLGDRSLSIEEMKREIIEKKNNGNSLIP